MYKKGMEQSMEKKTVARAFGVSAAARGAGGCVAAVAVEAAAAGTGRTDLAGTPPDRDEYRRGKLGSGL